MTSDLKYIVDYLNSDSIKAFYTFAHKHMCIGFGQKYNLNYTDWTIVASGKGPKIGFTTFLAYLIRYCNIHIIK